MGHLHSVHDTDAHLKINAITRVITNASSGKTVLIQCDHNSERFTFEVPRIVDGHDLSKCNVAQIHYINIDSANKENTSTGVYEADDLQISPDSNDVVILSWLISGNATKYAGSLNFLVKFKCVDDSGEVVYIWNTAIYTGISVSSGIDNGEDVVEEYADVLERWRQELIDTGGVTDDRIEQAVANYMAENPDSSQNANGLNDTARALLITILRNAVYDTDQSAMITALEKALASSGDSSGGNDPVVPDVPVNPEVTLASIIATYSGGDVAIGTALNNLTGIVVKAVYSDGSTKTVTDYTLSGEIAEGDNIITVTYQGKTATITVTGLAESGGDSDELMCEANIVLTGLKINKNATYNFYEFTVADGSNVYEIPVEAGVTYKATLTNGNQYGMPYWANNALDKVNAVSDFAISAEKLTDFTSTGRITATFDANATIDTTTAGTRVKNDDGTYSASITFTPAISGYLYTCNWNTENAYSIKKVVA